MNNKDNHVVINNIYSNLILKNKIVLLFLMTTVISYLYNNQFKIIIFKYIMKIQVSKVWISDSSVKKKFVRISSKDKNKIFRRSIYAIKDIKKSERITNKNLKILIPALSLKPKYFPKVLSKISLKDLKKSTYENLLMSFKFYIYVGYQ